jgi:ribosomal protein L7/L12
MKKSKVQKLRNTIKELKKEIDLKERIEYIETEEFQKAIVAMVVTEHYIQAIKAYRNQTKAGLKESKEMVDVILGTHGYIRDMNSITYWAWKKRVDNP